MLTLSQRRSLARNGVANVEREQTQWRAEETAKAATANRERIEANKIKRQTETDRVKFTRDDLKDARAIRTSTGWHAVVTINPTTVSVATGYSWVDRIPFSKILQLLN